MIPKLLRQLLRSSVVLLLVVIVQPQPAAILPTPLKLEADLILKYAHVSWYGVGFEGNRTASGTIFRASEFTAAHRTLPFGQLVMFFNPQNNRSVIVRITDRGPFIKHREFDLSHAAAKKLGIHLAGVSKIQYRLLHKEDPP